MQDLSKLLHNFIESDKKLFVFSPSTGRGKSYGMVQEILQLHTDEKITNKLFYITDRIMNVNEQYESMKDNGIDCLVLKGNTDYISDNIDLVKNLSEPFNGPELKEVINAYNRYEKNKERMSRFRGGNEWDLLSLMEERDTELRKEFEKAEREFRCMVRKTLDSIFAKELRKGAEPEEKLRYMESREELGDILSIYTGMNYYKHKVLLLTTQKFIRNFDPIIGPHIAFYKNDDAMQDSICFFDESDADKQVMIDQFSKESEQNEIDLIGIVRVYKTVLEEYIAGKYPDKFWNEKIIATAEKVLGKISELEYYGLIGGMTIMQDGGQFMYADMNKTIMADGNGPEYYINPINTMRNDFIIETENRDGIRLSEFALRCQQAFYDTNMILFRMAAVCEDSEKKDGSITIDLFPAIRQVMEISGLDRQDCSEILQRYIEDSSTAVNATKKMKNNDYYLNPGKYIKGEMKFADSVKMRLCMRQLLETPEKVLYTIIEKGAKIILSSATAEIRSASSNFDIDWEPLQDECYCFTDSEEAEYLDYCNGMDEFDDNFSVIVKGYAGEAEPFVECLNGMLNDGKITRQTFNKLKRPLLKDGNSQFFEVRLMEVALFVHDFCQAGGHTAIVFLPQDTNRNYNDNGRSEMERIVKYTGCFGTKAEHDEDCIIASMLSADIEDIRNRINVHDDKKPFIIITTYASAGKGLNLQYETDQLSDVVAINSTCKEKLEDILNGNGMNSKLCVDFDGIFVANPTNLFSGGVLKESYYIESMSVGDGAEIGKNMRKNKLQCLMRTYKISDDDNDSKKHRNGKWSDKSYEWCSNNHYGAAMAKIIQAVGRISRTGLKRKTVHIGVSGGITKHLDRNEVDKSQLLYNLFGNNVQFMPKELRELIKFIFGGSIGELQSQDIYYGNEMVITVTKKALELNSGGNPSMYKKIREALMETSCIISEKEYKGIGKKYGDMGSAIQSFYIKIAPFMVSGKKFVGYSYDSNIYDRENHVDRVYPKHKRKTNITDDPFCLADFFQSRKSVLLGDMDVTFDKSGKSYVLGPKGIEMYKGIIGERIGQSILSDEVGITLEELDDDVYEVVDNVYFENGRMVCFDFKYYSRREADSELDRKEPNIKRFKEKLDRLERHYGMPGILFVINTRPLHESINQMGEVYSAGDDGNRLYTVPYLVSPNGCCIKHTVEQLKTIINNWKGKETVQ